ncbi:hypothetical protein HY642_03645 [Candidatus Woesearchaeota archaeon]|nr:hypothetical protein [Candidatus Woesearchaeota archaeon]
MKRLTALFAAVLTLAVVVVIIIPLVTFILAAFVLLAIVAGVLAWLRRKGKIGQAMHRPQPQGETITVEYKESQK